MFGEEVILEKTIDYIAYRVKQGHEEATAKRELLQNLQYLDKFYKSIIIKFKNSNHSQSLSDKDNITNISKLDSVIDSTKAINIWDILEFDRIFTIESKTTIEYLIDCENIIKHLNQNIISIPCSGDIIQLAWTNELYYEYVKLLSNLSIYMSQLELQLTEINNLILKLEKN